jgi:hypothetical protein
VATVGHPTEQAQVHLDVATIGRHLAAAHLAVPVGGNAALPHVRVGRAYRAFDGRHDHRPRGRSRLFNKQGL